jgi:Tfp pilus assembly protein PilW
MILKRKNILGYTFVEMMISVLLLSIILLGVYGVFNTSNIIFAKDIASLDMEQQTRNAIDRIIREVRQASSQTITTNYNGTTNDQIIFTIPTLTGVKYYLSGTNLIREYPAGTLSKIASNIGLLKFTLTGSLLKIQVRADKVIYNHTTSFPLTENVRLRNE